MTAAAHDGSALADELLQRIGHAVGDNANARAIFGEPVEREGITVIPVAKARFGFGGGGGAGAHAGEEGSGGGGGGGAVVSPVGYIEVRHGTSTVQADLEPGRPGRAGRGGGACDARRQATADLKKRARPAGRPSRALTRGRIAALESTASHWRRQRSDLNAARTSAEKSSGSSQAAKWPPRSTSLK